MSSGGGSSASVQPVGGLFQGGVPKLRPVGGVLFVKNLFKGIAHPEIEMVCTLFVECHMLLVHKRRIRRIFTSLTFRDGTTYHTGH